ncbi:methyltransferase domain-containing protein [Desulfobulbus sp.]|uniref:class I SAM-dependent methyltransferase n=1 Tax=Desulfobulbus sp. TaxID=895 RepID=UPI00286F6794|nr:methyltransferase domain-containing protein [Desulfobulbus sp.]
MQPALFDTWTDRYDSWFATPVGRLVKRYETDLLLALLDPRPGEHLLDAGCGTGIFTVDVLTKGALVTGIDLSIPMLAGAVGRLGNGGFAALGADMCALPFADGSFDRVFSMTAIDFVADGGKAMAELDRVVRPGGRVVVTTLNSLGPWAEQRRRKGAAGHDLFATIHFRSPAAMRAIAPAVRIETATAIHFGKNDPLEAIPEIERRGREQGLDTGALVAVCWDKE